MKLSIVIPTYNRSEYLLDLLASVRELNLSCDYEIIISDNCSTDNTKSAVRFFQNTNKDLKISLLESKENYGFGFNINKAISHAKGDYIWPVGSDDIFLRTSINIEDCISKNTTFVLTDCISNNNSDRLFYKQKNIVYSDFLFLNNINTFSGALTFISSVIFKKEAYLNIKEFENDDYTHFINFYAYLNSCDDFTIYFAEDAYIKSGTASNDYNLDRSKHFLLDCESISKIGTLTKNRPLEQALYKILLSNYNFEYIKSISPRKSWEMLLQLADSKGLKLPFSYLKYFYYVLRKIL